MATGTGNLPYPGKVYNPFDILTAEELNEDVANIESLATGVGIGDSSLNSSKLSLGGASAYTGNVGTTNSSSYTTTLSGTPGVNPSVTVNLGGTSALISIGANISNSTGGSGGAITFAATGANTIAASNDNVYMAMVGSSSTDVHQGYSTYLLTGLNKGTTTFTLFYRNAAGGTASFQQRRISVVPLG